ncbi:MAG: DEAD/DEAH box helicase family protein, partial [Proteobacteria bacterium]|nr:DEAD/DEAH box helicase family protein [Pseudomonadota bacterium]
ETDSFCGKSVNHYSVKEDKIALFMSLFKGRSDVYAKRWQNKKGQSGYSPVCLNEWIPSVCKKPRIKCSKCNKKLYSALNEAMIEKHLQGEIVIGIYPMRLDETCCFLAIDFDNEGWEKDISVIREICTQIGIPVAVERSRSGNGGHVWFFFKEEISASLARRFGTSLLTYSMEKRHTISFESYDRLFPNQDTMPKGGFGNLIALPLQKASRKNENSLFVDEVYGAYKDQWKYLCDIQKLTEKELISFTTKFGKENELGMLKDEAVSVNKPWIKKEIKLALQDFPKTIEITKSGMLYIKKSGLTQKALNILKRFAAFKNPDFYRSQAMRMPTFNKPRVISCSEDFDAFLALPRGCEEDVINLIKGYNVKLNQVDETNSGRPINIEFSGVLRQEQQDAVDALMEQYNGVLSATTAFGKTVIGARLISLRKVNTLILVHRQQLLSQWVERLSQFLLIHETLPDLPKKRGRKKQLNVIGRLGAGKDNLSGIVDIAIMQSLSTGGVVKDCIKNYGMIIVDECHHVPAVSFEQILKNATARYIYGLTATPYRQDGHHPIIFFYCGPVRFLVDAKKQAEIRPFAHYLIPRFTCFKTGLNKNKEELSIQEIKSELVSDDIRNQLIVDDIVACYEKGRNSLVLTGRVSHVNSLSEILIKSIPDVISLTGGMGAKKTAQVLEKISSIPLKKPFVLVSTGSFIGEGFDEPRLDTLFLAMPISWKGTLQQYAGRLHRLYEDKKDVQIYDYVDIHVRMLENMYGKRLKGYASIGYKVKAGNVPDMPTDIIFDKHSFFAVYLTDIENALTQVLIVSPFITKKRVIQMMPHFDMLLKKQVRITIMTRPVEDFKEDKKLSLEAIFTLLKGAGVQVVFKSNIHQKFAIIDQKTTWYGSINLLSFGYSEESIMRLSSSTIAHELIKSLHLS